jgi:hypothetical protein
VIWLLREAYHQPLPLESAPPCTPHSIEMVKPALIANCDWSTASNKRWMAVAVRRADKFVASAPELVLNTADLLERIKKRRQEAGPVLVGFDFPIGVPRGYGEASALQDFRTALMTFGYGAWADWFRPAERPSEISVRRPFYPLRSGKRGTVGKYHLTTALQLSDVQLLRCCEQRIGHQRAACPLFWTIGPNQVGKAAIHGWNEILVRALSSKTTRTALWPFDGELTHLLEHFECVLCETYPAVAYRHLGCCFAPRESKRNQGHRKSKAQQLRAWFDAREYQLAQDVLAEVENGFGDSVTGEDRFDAFVGLLSMVDVVTGSDVAGVPKDAYIRRWEGWILGRGAQC